MTNPRINSPPTNTDANPDIVSGSVSFSFCLVSFLVSVPVLGNVFSSFVVAKLIHPMKDPVPAGFVKEMNDHAEPARAAFTPRCPLHLVGSRLERPIHEHRAANDVFSWDEAPIAAVKALLPIIAHGEVITFRYYQFLSLRICAFEQRPPCRDTLLSRRRESGELIPVVIVGSLSAQHVRLVERLTITINHAVTETNAVMGYSDNALDHVHPLFPRVGMDEHNDISPLNLPVGNQRSEVAGSRSGREPVHEKIVSDLQRVLHGRRGNHKRLRDKCNDEQG